MKKTLIALLALFTVCSAAYATTEGYSTEETKTEETKVDTSKKKKKNVEDSLLSAIEESSEEIDTLTEDSAEQVEDAAEKAAESALGETSEE